MKNFNLLFLIVFIYFFVFSFKLNFIFITPVNAQDSSIDCSLIFPDLKDSKFCPFIYFLHYQEISNGYSDGTYREKTNIKREEISKLIVEGFGMEINYDSQSQKFNDINKGNKFYDYILTLRQNSIVNGYPDNTYRPGNFIKRGELAKIVVNTIELVGTTPLTSDGDLPSSHFSDVPDNHVFGEHILKIKKAGIVSGYPDGTFKPDNFITRGEIAKVIANSVKFAGTQRKECSSYYCEDTEDLVIESALENHLFNIINNSRAEAGLYALQRDSRIDEIAKNWSIAMMEAETLIHNQSYRGYVDEKQIPWTLLAENVGQSTWHGADTLEEYIQMVELVHTRMMEEVPPNDGHKKNLLSTSLTHIGVGIKVQKQGNRADVWVTENFYK